MKAHQSVYFLYISNSLGAVYGQVLGIYYGCGMLSVALAYTWWEN